MADEPAAPSAARQFALSFKDYGLALGIIVASVPLATSGFDLLPVYQSVKSVLTFFTSLASYLGVAFVFSIRRQIGNAIFPSERRVLSKSEMNRKIFWQMYLPLGLIVGSVSSLGVFFFVLNISANGAALEQAYMDKDAQQTLSEYLNGIDEGQKNVPAYLYGVEEENLVYGSKAVFGTGKDERKKYSVRFRSEAQFKLVLELTPSAGIPYLWPILISYTLLFVSAAMAFVWFGIVEYLQVVMGLKDRDLLEDPYRSAIEQQFKIPEVKDLQDNPTPLYFELSFNPDAKRPSLVGPPRGPYCELHRVQLEYTFVDRANNLHTWTCSRRVDKQTESHAFILEYGRIDISQKLRIAAREALK